MRKPAFLSNERLSRFLVSMLLAMGLLLPLMFTFEAESALALYTGLTPDHPLFGRILDIYRALAVAAKA